MSKGPWIAINSAWAVNQPGLAVVSIDIDGDVTLLTPDKAEEMARALMRHAHEARACQASIEAQGGGQLLATPTKGTA